MSMAQKILILHDYFLYKGGGERLVVSLAKNLNADIATAFIAKDSFDPRDYGIKTYELYREHFFSRLPGFRYLQVQSSFLFKTSFIKNYDVIIYSADCCIATLRAKGKINISYMHTPPRHLYDCYQDRLREYPLWKKIIFVPFAIVNRWRFEWLTKKCDVIVTNSKNVQERIKHYLHLDSVVAYPPCNTLPFKNLGQGDYFFSWARLYPIKRVDMIVKAFMRMPDKKLVVASGGPELEKLRRMAQGHDNIKILGWVSDEELLKQLGNCLATIYFPIREDFGMSPVESMAAGKPVIGVAEGGMLEVIKDGKSGVLLKPGFTVEHIVEAVKQMTPEVAKNMEEECLRIAAQFTEEKFIAQMMKTIEFLTRRKGDVK
jgi:glycosyltransferase involved in cell wall biosynthesis